MSQERILNTVTGTTEHSRLEMALCDSPDTGHVLELRRLSWAKGIGWYRQQTLQLGPAEAEALLQTLRTSHHAWREGPKQPTGKVIPFPSRVPSKSPSNGGLAKGERATTQRARQKQRAARV